MPCIRHGTGLLFCPDAIQPHTSVYSVFCAVNAIIPHMPQNSTQGFAVAFPAIVPAQPPTIPDRHNKPLRRLRHAGKHTRARTRSADTGCHRHAWTLYRSAQPAYYNKVYKRVQHIADHASPAGQLLPCADRWQVIHPAHLLRGQRLHLYRVSPAARNHWRLPPHFFSGFRPIANRGQR